MQSFLQHRQRRWITSHFPTKIEIVSYLSALLLLGNKRLLFSLLLNQEAGTLIIDQPEDDLDNRVIMDIVKQIRNAKTRRQLIFTTHNANVVVNGDADKVVVLRPAIVDLGNTSSNARITIETDGAIETTKVKNGVTSTLEGGAEAFELRRRKYQEV